MKYADLFHQVSTAFRWWRYKRHVRLAINWLLVLAWVTICGQVNNSLILLV